MIKIITSLLLLIAGAFALDTAPEDFIKNSSASVEAKVNELVKSRYAELVNKTPPRSISFSQGEIYIADKKLNWRDIEGKVTVLVDGSTLELGYSIDGFVISPDNLKVAYYISYRGQDLWKWNVVAISTNPQIWLNDPAQTRMQNFDWNTSSSGFYYSYFHSKEDVAAGKQPITEVRYRDVFGQDVLVFDHGLAENFGLYDIDGGHTLAAYRLLNPGVGIKTTFSLYKGVKQQDGTYLWEVAYPRNQFVGIALGVYDQKVFALTSQFGDTYGVVAVDIKNNNRVMEIVPARPNQVLHTATLAGNQLVLQYHSIPEQNVSLVIRSLSDQSEKTISMSGLGLTSYGDLERFKFAPGATTSTAAYADVFLGNQELKLDLAAGNVEVLPNLATMNFDSQQMEQRLISFTASDGREITGRLYTRKDNEPKFVYIRHYGWISIKNSPEVREVLMAIDLGGAYFTVDLPGGGERGATWYRDGASNRLQSMKYIAEASEHLQNLLLVGPEKIVLMGRSWGGLTSLLMASYFPQHFGMINSVVPIIDVRDMFANGWFGRIAHSDLDPKIDRHGNYVLDGEFNNYVSRLNPAEQIDQIPSSVRLNLFTSGLDDRVDGDSSIESNYAYTLSQKLGDERFDYHRIVEGNHAARYYQILIFSLIAEQYGIDYQPLTVH